MKSSFTHLHLHTDNSLLDSIIKIPEAVKKAKAMGMTALAITDHGNGCGFPEFYDCCVKEGIKPILGCEVYEAPDSRFYKKEDENHKNYFHLILLAKNDIGYKNLCILISRSNTEGFYYKPRIDFDLLKEHSEGLICLSACIGGRVPQLIISSEFEKAEQEILRYRELFKEDYYLEIQNHGLLDEIKTRDFLYKMSEKHGIKLVATNDCHYLNSEDAEAHEWFLCIQTKKTITDESRMQYDGDYSMKSEEEMLRLFPEHPEAVTNTQEIADKCDFHFEYGNYRMPKVHIPEKYGNDYFGYLKDLAYEGLDRRYPKKHPEREQAEKNLEYELGIIEKMGFAEYFLDTRKTIMWAKTHGILVGVGRGSGAGSTMNYCIDITDIDPIKYGLLFERFLNPSRISMPDIDVDYDYAHKDEVIQYEAESNGLDHFAKIQTFGTLKAKGVLKDAARVAGYPVATGAALSKMIPNDPKMTLDMAWELNPDIETYINEHEGLDKVWQIAKKLEGLKRNSSSHACGHIPTPVPCEELFPVSVDSKTGYLVCQYDMASAEHLGNLKKDLLMLRNLSIIDETHKAIKQEYGKDIPLWTERILNNKKTLKMIAKGDTSGVFQLESEGMKNFMRELKPDCFEDIIAGVSLYRPGPMAYIPDYIRGKHRPETIKYLTPELEPILKDTYGIIVYQEDVMKIVQKLAGFSMGRADLVRKAMGKKKMDIMEAERQNFVYGNEELGIKGCIKNGISEKIAHKIYDQMIDFAKYAFNKSHAASYAAISMQTAYLKCHYYKEFSCGLLTSTKDKPEKMAYYIKETKAHGINILPPDINKSQKDFSIDGEDIRYGLSAVKGVGEGVMERCIKERENGDYHDLEDFVLRNPEIRSNTVKALNHVGVFDSMGYSRKSIDDSLEAFMSKVKKRKKVMLSGQMSLMDILDDKDSESLKSTIVDNGEYPQDTVWRMEKETSGMYISGHPLTRYEEFLNKNVTHHGDEFKNETESFTQAEDTEMDDDVVEIETPPELETKCELEDKEPAVIGGIVTEVKEIYTKKDSKKMAFITIEDFTGSIECVAFPTSYDKFYSLLKKDNKIIIKGTVSVVGDKASVLIDSVISFDNYDKTLWVMFDTFEAYTARERAMKTFVNSYAGYSTVNIGIRDARKFKPLPQKFGITEQSLSECKRLFGAENIAVK